MESDMEFLLKVARLYNEHKRQHVVGKILYMHQVRVGRHLRELDEKVGFEVFERWPGHGTVKPILTKEGEKLLYPDSD